MRSLQPAFFLCAAAIMGVSCTSVQQARHSDAAHNSGDFFSQHSSPRSPDYVRPVPEETSASGAPTMGHWQNATAPNGQQTRVWVPENSYQLAHAAEQQFGYKPFNAPHLDEPYAAAKGRYVTLRFPDGRLEYQWRAEEPSTPIAGFWQVSPDQEQHWIAGAAVNIANER